MKLRVVSLNTFGVPMLSHSISRRFEHIVEALQEEDPDIICLQEVFLYPHLHMLKVMLHDYPFTSFKRFLYGPKGGLVIFSKYPLKHTRFSGFTRRGSFKRASSLAAKLIRNGVLSVELRDHNLIIYNTHLTANTDVEWSESNHFSQYLSSQLVQITAMVQQDRESSKELIVTGDFNIPPDSFLYRDFIKSSGLVDLFTSKSRPTYHEHFLPLGKIAKQIDYIFISKNEKSMKKLSADYIMEHPIEKNGKSMYLSDHLGIIANVQIPSVKVVAVRAS